MRAVSSKPLSTQSDARPATRRRARGRALCAGLLVLGWAGAAAAGGPPKEGSCPQIVRGPGALEHEDAVAVSLKEGMALQLGDLIHLRKLLPAEIWTHRDTFFYEGMRLEIGGCHRDYPPSAAYQAATESFAGRPHLDADGNLRDYVAGRPFPADSIDEDDPAAGAKWAWNFEQRDRGAGPVGSFRILDLPGRIGTPQFYSGTWFFAKTGHRADLAATKYRAKEGGKHIWVAGGQFEEPFDARHLAWRQLRSEKTSQRFEEPDDTFVYVPSMRKVRRAATTWVDGLYAPRYLIAGTEGGGGGVPFGSNEYGPAGSIQPTAGLSIAATENLRRGFIGLAIRPNAYEWRFLEEREVIAPLNASIEGWPAFAERNYGPGGLSVATDRWDVRWAVVLEGRARRVMDGIGYVRLWIDWQTGQPLYYISERPGRRILDIGILVHFWSGDRAGYPEWPELGHVHVFDPVAAVFLDDGGQSGWRRESYDVISVPVDGQRLRKMATVDSLSHGR